MKCKNCERIFRSDFFHHSIKWGWICLLCWDRLTELKDEAKRDEWEDKRGRDED